MYILKYQTSKWIVKRFNYFETVSEMITMFRMVYCWRWLCARWHEKQCVDDRGMVAQVTVLGGFCWLSQSCLRASILVFFSRDTECQDICLLHLWVNAAIFQIFAVGGVSLCRCRCVVCLRCTWYGTDPSLRDRNIAIILLTMFQGK